MSSLSAAAEGPGKRPHIVLFIGDDLTWHDIGPYGGKEVRTPNLDRLAGESVKFTHAVAASPTCTPSRSALFTGLYPFRNGAHANHSLVNEGVRTMADEMKGLGYRVVLAGKSHIGPREAFAFEYLKGSNVMPPGKDHVLWTDLNTARVDELLGSHDKATPLCLIVASHSPHVYWPENEQYKPREITLPPTHVDTPQTRQTRCQYYTDVTHMDEQVGDVLKSLEQRGYAQNTIFLFTADQGAQWPFSKWTLYDAGVRTPLLVRWPGKVKAGTTSDALVSLVDLMPTFIEAGGGKPSTELDGRSLVGAITGAAADVHDAVFAAHTGDKDINQFPMRCIRTKQFKYILNLAPQNVFKTHIDAAGGRDGKQYWDSWEKKAEGDAEAKKVIDRYRHHPAEELYDIAADPHELKNLAGDPAHAKTLDELREKLKAWRVQQGEDLEKVPMPEDARTGSFPYAE